MDGTMKPGAFRVIQDIFDEMSRAILFAIEIMFDGILCPFERKMTAFLNRLVLSDQTSEEILEFVYEFILKVTDEM